MRKAPTFETPQRTQSEGKMALSKKIYDSVHGFIRFNEVEQQLIDSRPFQRLHYIHQLGIAYIVYPGATHTRFEHSLGAMELASRIFDQIQSRFEIPDAAYWKQVLRLSALCHDLGHLPFSHVAEEVLLGKGGHERWTAHIIRSAYLQPIWRELEEQFGRKGVEDDIVKMAVGEHKLKEIDPALHFSPLEKMLAQVICADFFGADRIDYLLRDAQCTGVSHGLFDYHQLIETLLVLPGLSLGIEEDGIESCEALLLARHFMHRRVYQYSSVKAYSYHLAQFIKEYLTEEMGKELTLDGYLSFTDNEVLTALWRAAKDPSLPGHEHALCLTDRKKRFRAHRLSDEMDEQKLFELKEKLDIPEEEIAWDLSHKEKKIIRLSFPVLKRNGAIVDASLCSEIAIPLVSPSWVYVSPQHAFPV